MRITDISKMRTIVTKMRDDDVERGRNRAAINHLFNGGQPYTNEEARENSIYTNVQPLMAPRLAHDARRQLANASTRTGNYFQVRVDLGNETQQSLVSSKVTRAINRILKKSLRFGELLRGIDANVILHGRGPVMWDDAEAWMPTLLSIEDLKVPSGANIDFSNLTFFAVYQEMTAAELWKKIENEKVAKALGWDVAAVKDIVKRLGAEQLEVTSEDRENFPEKLAEDLKQNGTYYNSDNVPNAKCWWFFQLTDDGDSNYTHRWEVCMFEDSPSGEKPKSNDFLFKQQGRFAEEIGQILHVHYADGSNVAPFKYHSVRGLGYLLYPVMQLFNRLFCRSMDAYFESCNQLFKNVGEEDRERLQNIQLANMGVLPPGVSYVPATERYTVNHNLLNAAFAMLRQFISENSASFTQDQDSGTSKEMTATEAMARVQQATAMVSSMLGMQATYRQFMFNEICRRFCIKGSRDKDVKKFQELVKKDGVPESAINFDLWDVIVERTIGGGNKTLEIVQATELMKARPLYPPAAQSAILRDYTLALTDDPDKTIEWIPEEPQQPSKSEVFAGLAIGTLMQSLPVPVTDGINLDVYAGTLLRLLGAKVQQTATIGVTPSAETVMGMIYTGNHIGQVFQQIAQDEGKRDMVKQAMTMLQQMMVPVQAWADQLKQQQESAQLTPEAQSKIVSSRILAQNQAQIKESQATQKMEQRQQMHAQKMAESQLKLQAELEAKDFTTAAELKHSAAAESQKRAQEAFKLEQQRKAQQNTDTDQE